MYKRAHYRVYERAHSRVSMNRGAPDIRIFVSGGSPGFQLEGGNLEMGSIFIR